MLSISLRLTSSQEGKCAYAWTKGIVKSIVRNINYFLQGVPLLSQHFLLHERNHRYPSPPLFLWGSESLKVSFFIPLSDSLSYSQRHLSGGKSQWKESIVRVYGDFDVSNLHASCSIYFLNLSPLPKPFYSSPISICLSFITYHEIFTHFIFISTVYAHKNPNTLQRALEPLKYCPLLQLLGYRTFSLYPITRSCPIT